MIDRARLLTTLLSSALACGWACHVSAESRDAPVVEVGGQVKEAEAGPLQREVPPKPAENQAEGEEKQDNRPTDKELREKLIQLERELQQTRQALATRDSEPRLQREKQAEIDLNTITLPDNPTRAQCEAYLAELREVARNRRNYFGSDPLVAKLKALPDEHFDLLLTEMTNRSEKLRYFAGYVLRETEPEKMRERFVQNLEQNENNIGVIVINGWCEDVRPIIVKKIKSDDQVITPAWFQAAVELKDPELYPRLHEITINSRDASQFLTMLQSLPDYDLSNTVNICWARANQGEPAYDKPAYALLAANQGNVDALGVLVSQLSNTVNYYYASSLVNPNRISVLSLIDFRGSNAEIQQWYNDNREKLVFDAFRGRFTLPD